MSSWHLANSSWLLAFGFWLLAFGSWLLAFGFWLLAFGQNKLQNVATDKTRMLWTIRDCPKGAPTSELLGGQGFGIDFLKRQFDPCDPADQKRLN
jgi:hypothetical protein